MVAAVFNGFALETSTLAWISLVQQFMPLARMERVASVKEIGSLALIPLGFAVAGRATMQLARRPPSYGADC